jgi:hypothetical protein
VAARRVAGPARVVRPRLRGQGPLPALPPVARGALDHRGNSARRRRGGPAHPTLRGVGQVEHHRLDGPCPIAPAQRRQRADLRQGRRHHRPEGARPAAAGDRRRARPHPGHDRSDRREVATAQGCPGRQRRPGHHHDVAEVPGGRETGGRGGIRGCGQGRHRAAVRGDRRRGALLLQRRLGGQAEEGADRGGRAGCVGGSGSRGRGGFRTRCGPAGQRPAPGQTPEPVVLRVHGDPETQDAQHVRAERRRRAQAAVPHVLDAAGDRRGVHPRRAAQQHDVRRVLQAREQPPAHRSRAGDAQGARGPGPVRVAAPLPAGRQGRGHRRALPAEVGGQDERARQGHGRHPFPAARGADEAGAGRVHRAQGVCRGGGAAADVGRVLRVPWSTRTTRARRRGPRPA